MSFSRGDLDFFEENGYLILRGFAKEIECDAILDTAKVHIKYKIEPIETEEEYHLQSKKERIEKIDYNSKIKGTIRRLRQAYSRDVIFKNWMENRKIRPILREILKDRLVLVTAHHNSIMTKMPNSSTQTKWHQDIRYWSYRGDNLVSVWLALGEENSLNGALEFIPKSHKMSFSPNQFDKKEYFREDLKENMSLIETKQSVNLSKGDVLIFHSKLLHRANKNSTQNPKISFVYTIKGALTKAVENSRSALYPEIFLD